MDWIEEFTDIGIDDVHRLDIVVPSEDVDGALLRMLPKIKSQAARTTLTVQQESDLVPAFTLFNTPSVLAKHKADFHIYLEACLAYSKFNTGRFLVTDNHRFFKIFLQSFIAEESLHTVCTRTLNILQGVSQSGQRSYKGHVRRCTCTHREITSKLFMCRLYKFKYTEVCR